MPLSTGNMRRLTQLDTTAYFDMFLVAGQSNAVGRGNSKDATLDAPSAGVWQFKQDGSWEIATEPLDHPTDPVATKIGFALTFGKLYYAAYGRRVLLVPCAVPGSSIVTQWQDGDTEYEFAVSQVRAARLTVPAAKLNGILWHQGEESYPDDNLTGAQHTAYLLATLGNFRTDFGISDLPFVLGGMVPAWVAEEAGRGEIQAALEAFPGEASNVAYAASTDLVYNSAGDAVHFNAESQRTFGARYFAAYQTLV